MVAGEPLKIANFAYGVEEAPTTAWSVDVERLTKPISVVVQPPPEELPLEAMVPQVMSPKLSVWRASPPIHDERADESVSVEEI